MESIRLRVTGIPFSTLLATFFEVGEALLDLFGDFCPGFGAKDMDEFHESLVLLWEEWLVGKRYLIRPGHGLGSFRKLIRRI